MVEQTTVANNQVGPPAIPIPCDPNPFLPVWHCTQWRGWSFKLRHSFTDDILNVRLPQPSDSSATDLPTPSTRPAVS